MNRKIISLFLALFVSVGWARPAPSPFFFTPSNAAQAVNTIVKALLGNGYALVPDQAFFGDCSDGNLTLTTGLTLGRDMFYNNLTIGVGGGISFQNQRVFVCGILDITAAGSFSLDGSGASGTNGANGGGAGSNGNNIPVGTNINGRSGGNGGAGGATTGTQGSAGAGGNVITSAGGGLGGKGGDGTSGVGGAQRAAAAVTAWPMRDITTWFLPATGSGAQIFIGGSGSGGGGGGGDVADNGGGGGGGGASGETVYISANIIKTSVSTAAGVFSAWGGSGGNGGSPTAGNAGGGGGGGGGAGGWIVIKYNLRTGAVISNLALAPGGFLNSTGGTGHGTGTNGANGVAGTAGLIQLLDLSTGKITSSVSGGANF